MRAVSRQALATRSFQLSRTHLKNVFVRVLAPTLLWAALVMWALSHPAIRMPAYTPPHAALILGGLIFATAIFVRFCQGRFTHGHPAAISVLPDPLYTLYLATIVLTGTPNAVLFAAITPLVEYAPDIIRHPRRASAALRHAAISGLTTLVAGVTYVNLWPALAPRLTVLRAHSIAALIAAVVLFAGAACVSSFEQGRPIERLDRSLRTYLMSPAARFQVLLLCIAPLLPLANLLDAVETEFAWIIILLPLCAVYYLALVSVRLQQRTNELQLTVGQLETARRRQAELTDYAALITRAQEDERLRLARELHDDTAQALIALSRGLDTLAARHVEPPLPDPDIRFIAELGSLSKRTLDSVRRACQDLRPSVLDDLGLAAALASLAQSTSKRGLACSFQQTGEAIPCAPEVEVTIYRIAQEALSNALRHANASETTLDLTYWPRSILLRVSDNGCGFDADKASHLDEQCDLSPREPHGGLGMLGMRERAALIGAHLEVHSVLQQGTTIMLQAPSTSS